MTALSRYITILWLRMFLLCLGSFISLYLALDMMEKIPRFLRAGGETESILHFFYWKLPEMFGQISPFSVLMATLLTLGLLSRTNEIVAMQSCGINLLRITFPIFCMGFLATLLLLVNAELIVPLSYQRMEKIERVDIKKQGLNAVFRRDNIWFRYEDSIIQAQLFDPQNLALKGVVYWKFNRDMIPSLRVDADTTEFRGGRWVAIGPVIREFGAGKGGGEARMVSMPLDLDLKVDDLRVLDNNADNLSYRKLKEYAENLKRGGYDASRYLTMMNAKISAPFSAFVMVILGIPFALRNSRSGGVALGIGTSIGIGFVYFVANAILVSYGRSGALPPLVAAWGANLLFTTGGIWLAMTVRN